MAEIVKVNKERLEELVRAEATLEAFDAAGVDNWEGNDFVERPTDEQIAEEIQRIVEANESKYLRIYGNDYAAVTFEDEFKGDRLEIWNKSKEAGKALEFETDDVYFEYEALTLDDDTVETIQENMDYDDSKHENYFKVEG